MSSEKAFPKDLLQQIKFCEVSYLNPSVLARCEQTLSSYRTFELHHCIVALHIDMYTSDYSCRLFIMFYASGFSHYSRWCFFPAV